LVAWCAASAADGERNRDRRPALGQHDRLRWRGSFYRDGVAIRIDAIDKDDPAEALAAFDRRLLDPGALWRRGLQGGDRRAIVRRHATTTPARAAMIAGQARQRKFELRFVVCGRHAGPGEAPGEVVRGFQAHC
jgi:hypothetical protein